MFTYKWSDLIELVKKQVKGIPTQTIDALQCDWVSSRIANRLPWKPLEQTIAAGQIPLIDNQQDYDPPFNISKLTEASLRRTSDTPGEDISLNILDSLPRDPRRRSVYAITSIALQAGVGKLRLLAAVALPVNQTWELRGQYEMNPTKIVSTEQGLWFDDKYVHLAIEGLKYCYFQMADDPRAGTTSGTWPGDISYTGQLAQFMSGIKEMADAETRNLDQQTMPDAPLGIASRQYGAMIAGYGFGFGGGPGSGTGQCGLVSLNNDTTPAQWLVAGPGISITSVGIGYTMISLIGTAPPLEPPTVTAISPATGPTAGGTVVTITGTGFAPGATVVFGTNAATNVTVVSDTTITATTPPGVAAGLVTVWVTVTGQIGSLSNAFTYVGAPPVVPTVTSVSPNVGPANTTTAVTITGTNFTSPATVTFGGTAATNVVVVNATSITCTAPARAAGTVAVAVTVSGQTGTLNNAFTYQAPAAPIYGGLGAASDATGVEITGGMVVLVPYSGDVLAVLQNTPETVGQSFGPFSPSDQAIYLLLVGGSHTFLDQNNNTFAMNPPIQQTVNGRTMYLYGSTNVLYLTWTIKIAS